MRDVAFLFMNGVPYAEAMRMSAARRLAWIVTIGELKGGRWNWGAMCWEPPDR